jgi:uncharacterized protein YyaL (SSP411 family)
MAAHYLPFAIVIPVAPGASQERVARRLPFVGPMTAQDDAAAYVCRDFACQRPVSRPEDLRAIVSPAA